MNINGTDFNRLMIPTHQATATYIDDRVKKQEADLWDGMLPDDDMEFLVDLTGEWTLCKLPYSYSNLMGDSHSIALLARVEKWEQSLRKLLPFKEIIRVDDFLVDEWESRYDYLLVRHPQAVKEFVEWLQTQDHRYWVRLPTLGQEKEQVKEEKRSGE
jgi:hypothetical protein